MEEIFNAYPLPRDWQADCTSELLAKWKLGKGELSLQDQPFSKWLKRHYDGNELRILSLYGVFFFNFHLFAATESGTPSSSDEDVVVEEAIPSETQTQIPEADGL